MSCSLFSNVNLPGLNGPCRFAALLPLAGSIVSEINPVDIRRLTSGNILPISDLVLPSGWVILFARNVQLAIGKGLHPRWSSAL